MPVIIPENLPATEQLQKENIFVMNNKRAKNQDIRPLQIIIVNLMPIKIETETQILRLLGNNIIQMEVTFIHMATHESKNTPKGHLDVFYTTFDKVLNRNFDAMIFTGAPVENMEFQKVYYWPEVVRILDWAKKNVYSSLFICWGAQAALFHYYNIRKEPLKEKMFGVFEHRVVDKSDKLTINFDDIFYAPHSRHTGINIDDVLKSKDIKVISESPEAGPYILISEDKKEIFVTGHPEYDSDTLKKEYVRDIEKGIEINIPSNYFKDDDPDKKIIVKWRGHSNILYANWINYYVYQETNYDLNNK